jgi:hypothetical protein
MTIAASCSTRFAHAGKTSASENANKSKISNTSGIDDYDLIWVLLEQGASVKVLERSLYNYRDHEGERLTLADPAEMTETLRKILRQHRMSETELEQRLASSARWFGRPIQEVLRAAGKDPLKSGD